MYCLVQGQVRVLGACATGSTTMLRDSLFLQNWTCCKKVNTNFFAGAAARVFSPALTQCVACSTASMLRREGTGDDWIMTWLMGPYLPIRPHRGASNSTSTGSHTERNHHLVRSWLRSQQNQNDPCVMRSRLGLPCTWRANGTDRRGQRCCSHLRARKSSLV